MSRWVSAAWNDTGTQLVDGFAAWNGTGTQLVWWVPPHKTSQSAPDTTPGWANDRNAHGSFLPSRFIRNRKKIGVGFRPSQIIEREPELRFHLAPREVNPQR